MTELPRGIRLNNPGCIKRTKDVPKGMAPEQPDPELYSFITAVLGIRYMAHILTKAYQDKRGLRTVEKIIPRWSATDQEAYIKFVCKRAKVGRGATLDLHQYGDLRPLVEAIIAFENAGYAYPDAVLDKGLLLAGVEPPQKDLSDTRTIKGAKLATAATGTGVLVEAARQLEPVLPFLDQAIYYIKLFGPWAVAAIALLGIGWMVWARIDDKRRGLR